MNNYDISWGSESLHQQHDDNEPQNLDVDQLIAVAVRSPSNPEWINELASGYVRSNQASGDFLSGVINQDITIHWINKLFAKLQEITERFNRGLQTYSIMIECSPPDFHSVRADDKSPEIDKVVFEGHISTPKNALLIRGSGQLIQAFIVPSNVWLGISLNELHEDDYPPFMTLHATKNSLKTQVMVDGAEKRLSIENSSLPLLARLLFSRLVESDFET